MIRGKRQEGAGRKKACKPTQRREDAPFVGLQAPARHYRAYSACDNYIVIRYK